MAADFTTVLSQLSAKAWRSALLCLVAVFLSACDGAPPVQQINNLEQRLQEQGRVEIDLNAGWLFSLGSLEAEAQSTIHNEIFSVEGWEAVDLPHTWNAADGADGGGDYVRGDGWYRKVFQLDAGLGAKQYYLEFDGANTVTDVWLNGVFVGQHRGGYAKFRFDVSTALNFEGPNVLAVRVNNAFNPDIPPLSGDWTFYGGLYRDVSLLVTQPIHIETLDYASQGVYLTPVELSAEQAEVDAEILLINHSSSAVQAEVNTKVLSHTGDVVLERSSTQNLPPGQLQRQMSRLSMTQPRLWRGRSDPYLYTVQTDLFVAGERVDSVVQPLGLRTVGVDPQRGFLLNGTAYPLYGAGLHQGRADVGWADSDAQRREDFDLLDELGVTSLRLAHYQHDELAYSLADQRGIVLWTELPLVNQISDTPAFADSARQQLRELIHQRYNHPSVAIWGLFNEISMLAGPDPTPLLAELDALAHQLDSSRIVAASALGAAISEQRSVAAVGDAVAGNVYFGWYYDDFSGLQSWLEGVRAEQPARPVAVGEYGAGASPNLHAAQPVAQDHTEEYQALFHEASWPILRDRPDIWAKYIWVAFDFASDLRDEGEQPGINDKGLVSADRRTRKDAFYFYKTHWNATPQVFLTSRRFDVRYRESAEVKVYANVRKVELRVNGISYGQRVVDDTGIVRWADVPLALGKNKLEVLGVAASGEQVKDTVVWTREKNPDTTLSSVLVGVDLVRNQLVNLPDDIRLSQLDSVVQRPFGATWQLLHSDAPDPPVGAGDVLRVTAASGATRDYQVVRDVMSRSRRVTANRELKKGVMGYPNGKASNANDGISSIDTEDLAEVNFWITADPSAKRAWWKVDLGADYYIERVAIDWLPRVVTPEATVQYSIDLAPDTGRGFDVIGEQFEMAVDGRNNTVKHRVEQDIGRIGRHVRVSIEKSDYAVDMSLMGKFTLVGMSEFSATGGLLYSDQFVVDYSQRTITVPANTDTTVLRDTLKVVPGVTLQLVADDGSPVQEQQPLVAAMQVIATREDLPLKEIYTLQMH